MKIESTTIMPKLLHWKAIRELSFRELATKTGIDAGSLCKLFNGKRGSPQITTLKKIAKALDVEVKDLV